jgi:hypothetical protein
VDLVALLQIGGPTFSLAAFVIWLGNGHVKHLITLVGNHLKHVEAEMAANTEEARNTRSAIERLIDRMDRYYLED